MNHVSLFTGIGGIDLAAEWAGFETVCFVENDDYCQQVLRKHWPDVPIIGDIKDVTKEKIMAYAAERENHGRKRGNMDSKATGGEGVNPSANSGSQDGIILISGGFPCQPHSVAGKREGSADERNLWPEFRRVIGKIKPRWVLAENVPGVFSSDAGRFFGSILSDLAKMGYATGWATYGAVDVGALHRRNRVFIVAYSIGRGEQQSEGIVGEVRRWTGDCCQDVADTQCEPPGHGQCGRSQILRKESSGRNLSGWWPVEPDVGRVAHGVPARVDRLKCLGNAVVPQQIYPILKAIADIEREL